jgi:23S rRNA (pseudouridine1915-N3)-methyltransferase
VGPLSRGEPLDEAARLYADRLTHYAKFDLRLVEAGVRRGGQGSAGEAEKAEAERLRKAAPPRARQVALWEKGKAHGTLELSRRLEAWMNGGRDVVIYQGGPTGLLPALLTGCDETWSLSPLTLPHRLARVVALEALYRAFTVLRGEPYHRA